MIQRSPIKTGLNGYLSGLFDSSATFKKCLAEKAVFIALGLIDLGLTLLAADMGLSEINPVIRFFLQAPLMLLIVKFFIPVLIAWLVPGKLLWPSIALMAAVLVWNVKELLVFLA